MRIVMMVPAFPRLSETFIVGKFIGLRQMGWDVHVVCGENSREALQLFPGLQQQAKHRIHVSWPHRPRWLALLLTPIAFLRCLFVSPRSTFRYLWYGWKMFKWDIVRRLYLDAEFLMLQPYLIHFEFGALAPERMYLKQLLKCKILVSFRGYDLNFSGLDQVDYYDAVWHHADALHLLGRDLWSRALRRGCPPNAAHALIPPAVRIIDQPKDESKMSLTVGTPERPLRMLSVGRLTWVKGYEYALQAVKILAEKDIKCEYRIIGDGDLMEGISFARHQLGIESFVDLHGAQPPDEVKKQMEWADVFLQASVQEGFCNAVIEAQSMEIPVVCTDAGGLPENVENEVTGFVVPRRNPQALAEKMAILARDPALRHRMGNAGRQRVLTHFRLEDQIKKFADLYTQVLESEAAHA